MLASIVRESCQSDRFAARSLLPQEKDRASCKVVFLVLWLPWAFILCYMYVGEVDKNDEITSYMYYKINIAVANGVIKSTFIWLTEQHSTTLSCRSSLRMGWSVEFVTWNGSKHTDREWLCEHIKKETKSCCYYPFPTGPSPGIFVFSVTTESPHPHHEKMPNSINFVWLLCKILNPGLQRPDNPQVEGGGGNNRNWSMYKCSWLMHVVDLCWMLLLSDFKRLLSSAVLISLC